MDRDSWERASTAATAVERFGSIIESVATADAGEYDAVLLGEPYDRGTVARRGARDGPVAVRAALAGVATHHLDAGPVEAVGDLGSVDVPFGASVPTAREAVRETIDDVHDSDAVPILIGGDSSLTVANVAGLLGGAAATADGYTTDGGFGDDEESVGDVEHFDPGGGDTPADDEAELTDETSTDTDADDRAGATEDEAETDEGAESAESDDSDAGSEEVVDVDESGFGTDEATAEVVEESAVTAETNSVGVIRLGPRLDCQPVGSRPTSRSVGRELLDAGVDDLAVVGVRHFESTTAEAEYLREHDGAVVTAEEVGEDAVEAAGRALASVEAESLYLSIDLSVLDATAAPGVSDPVPGGLQSRELFRVVRLLAGVDRLAGLEVVETAPAHDREDRTVDAAARTVAHALAALQA